MLDYDCIQLFESRIYPAQPGSLGIHPQAEERDRARFFQGTPIMDFCQPRDDAIAAALHSQQLYDQRSSNRSIGSYLAGVAMPPAPWQSRPAVAASELGAARV